MGIRLGDRLEEMVTLDENDFNAVLQKTGEQLVRNVYLDTYSRQGYYNDNGQFVPWQPRVNPTNHRILFKTGNMKSSFNFRLIEDGILKIWNTAPYSGYHQHGTAHLPPRPILYMAPQVEDHIRESVIRRWNQKIRRGIA